MAVYVDESALARECEEALADVRRKYARKPGALIGALQLLQDKVGYLPREALGELATIVGATEAELFGVVTFYGHFSLVPRGRHTIRLCRGTACHVKGGAKVLSGVKQMLGVEDGQTTDDLNFTLEVVGCLGACSLAPVMMVDNDYYAKLTPDRTRQILGQISAE